MDSETTSAPYIDRSTYQKKPWSDRPLADPKEKSYRKQGAERVAGRMAKEDDSPKKDIDPIPSCVIL